MSSAKWRPFCIGINVLIIGITITTITVTMAVIMKNYSSYLRQRWLCFHYIWSVSVLAKQSAGNITDKLIGVICSFFRDKSGMMQWMIHKIVNVLSIKIWIQFVLYISGRPCLVFLLLCDTFIWGHGKDDTQHLAEVCALWMSVSWWVCFSVNLCFVLLAVVIKKHL